MDKYTVVLNIAGESLTLIDKTKEELSVLCQVLNIKLPLLEHYSETRGRMVDISKMHPNHCKNVIRDIFSDLECTAVKIKNKEYVEYVNSKLNDIKTLLNQIETYESSSISQKR